jgi:hypothetical protein
VEVLADALIKPLGWAPCPASAGEESEIVSGSTSAKVTARDAITFGT